MIGAFELYNRWRERGTAEATSYYKIERWQRVVVAVTYLGLAAFLAVAMHYTHIERTL